MELEKEVKKLIEKVNELEDRVKELEDPGSNEPDIMGRIIIK